MVVVPSVVHQLTSRPPPVGAGRRAAGEEVQLPVVADRQHHVGGRVRGHPGHLPVPAAVPSDRHRARPVPSSAVKYTTPSSAAIEMGRVRPAEPGLDVLDQVGAAGRPVGRVQLVPVAVVGREEQGVPGRR